MKIKKNETEYIIYNFEMTEMLMRKTAPEMKEWIKKYSVTDNKGNPLDLRKAKTVTVIQVNGAKWLRVRSSTKKEFVA